MASSGSKAALSKFCSAQMRLENLKEERDRSTQPVRKDLTAIRANLRKFMADNKATCVPMEIKDDGGIQQMYLRLTTSKEVTPFEEDTFLAAFETITFDSLRTAFTELSEAEQRRRKKKGEVNRVITIDAVFTKALENAVRARRTVDRTNLTLSKSCEKKVKGAPAVAPIIAPQNIKDQCQALYDLSKRLSSTEGVYKDRISTEKKTVEECTPVVGEQLKRENPNECSKRLNLKGKDGQSRIPCEVKYSSKTVVGKVRITEFSKSMRTSLQGLFKPSLLEQPVTESVLRSVTESSKKSEIFQRLRDSFQDLVRRNTKVDEKVKLEFSK